MTHVEDVALGVDPGQEILGSPDPSGCLRRLPGLVHAEHRPVLGRHPGSGPGFLCGDLDEMPHVAHALPRRVDSPRIGHVHRHEPPEAGVG